MRNFFHLCLPGALADFEKPVKEPCAGKESSDVTGAGGSGVTGGDKADGKDGQAETAAINPVSISS